VWIEISGIESTFTGRAILSPPVLCASGMPGLSGMFCTQYPPPNIRKKHLAGILARSPGIFRKMNQETQEMETLKPAS
jgi:hypothetical protein